MSPDGEAIVTGAGDETLRFWNVFSKARSQKESKSALNLFTSIRQVLAKKWNEKLPELGRIGTIRKIFLRRLVRPPVTRSFKLQLYVKMLISSVEATTSPMLKFQIIYSLFIIKVSHCSNDVPCNNSQLWIHGGKFQEHKIISIKIMLYMYYLNNVHQLREVS